jgi:hypothetical protein
VRGKKETDPFSEIRFFFFSPQKDGATNFLSFIFVLWVFVKKKKKRTDQKGTWTKRG